MSINSQKAINWIEQGFIPDNIIRKGIRRLLKSRLKEIHADNAELANTVKQQFIKELVISPIAVSTDKANEQHYEVPAEFYTQVLGQHQKYSCCYWNHNTHSLSEAEENALNVTCQNADIHNGQDILELGCGWGSLTLWLAKQYPACNITAVSNSHSQKEHIEKQAHNAGLRNITVITCDMKEFEIDQKFDRVVSVEMFEHMRNWKLLFKKVSHWLNENGKFFMHVFAHRQVPYLFTVNDSSDWMSKYFFTGGMMPCDDLALYFQDNLKLANDWTWNGNHYAYTSNAWLMELDTNKNSVLKLFDQVYGKDQSQLWLMRWRIFFMACAELFAYDNGQQWHVKHYLFEKR